MPTLPSSSWTCFGIFIILIIFVIVRRRCHVITWKQYISIWLLKRKTKHTPNEYMWLLNETSFAVSFRKYMKFPYGKMLKFVPHAENRSFFLICSTEMLIYKRYSYVESPKELVFINLLICWTHFNESLALKFHCIKLDNTQFKRINNFFFFWIKWDRANVGVSSAFERHWLWVFLIGESTYFVRSSAFLAIVK